MNFYPAKSRLQALRNLTLNTSKHIQFRRWVALYRTRFPYQELAPVPAIAESLNQQESVINGLIDSKTHDWAVFTLTEFYGTSTLLAYLATAPDYEGKGLARQAVNSALNNTLSKDTPYFWLEATPKLWGFYKKLGFKRLQLEYRIPEFYGSGSEKMGLFVRTHLSITHIEKKVVESFVSELLLSGYGIKESDPRYQQQMQVIHSYPHDIIEVE